MNATRIPIEQKESIRWLENLQQSTQLANPSRCIHIGDRESDIYELFCLAVTVPRTALAQFWLGDLRQVSGTSRGVPSVQELYAAACTSGDAPTDKLRAIFHRRAVRRALVEHD